MVLDTQGLRGRRNSSDHDDVLQNLWEAVPFPRLPIDAPARLKELTITIHDPRRVLAINRASRRHNVQTIIERYIAQIQFGCGVKSCRKPTCFSSRMTSAAGAPIRRYNPTSARTLATYLASQNNPKQGLCNASIPQASIPSNTPPQVTVRKSVTVGNRDIPDKRTDDGNMRNDSSEKRVTRDSATGSSASTQDQTWIDPVVLGHQDDPTTKYDPRSFVQNVFETVAFRMLEWLTPKVLESAPLAQHLQSQNATTDTTRETSSTKYVSTGITGNDPTVEMAENVQECRNEDGKRSVEGEQKAEQDLNDISVVVDGGERHKNVSDTEICPTIDTKDHPPTTQNVEETNPSQIMPVPEIIEGSVNEVEQLHMSDDSELSEGKSDPNPDSEPADTGPLSSGHPTSPADSKGSSQPDDQSLVYISENSTASSRTLDLQTQSHRLSQDADLPQSLSSLPVEVIDLICDILHADNTYEEHSFHPQSIPVKAALKRIPLSQISQVYPSSLKAQWHHFIDQSVFDVLSRPESLLHSFSNEQNVLHDSQTLWWLLVKMMRIAPSLVLHSLWNVAGTLLYSSSPNISEHPRREAFESELRVSNVAAAQVLIVCLHALVATLPVIYGEQHHLANMSRARSYGLVLPGRSQINASYQTRLCLLYDDVFANDLALRLARRIFNLISQRRRDVQDISPYEGASQSKHSELDMLEVVLASLDFGSPSFLSIPDAAREFHQQEITILILEWARTVMLQDWTGVAEVSTNGPFGGALALIAAIYQRRNSLLVGDIYFRTQFFAERLDAVEAPVEWLSFKPNKMTTHLFDYPYLFDPSTLVNYFRAINFSRMNEAYETAKAKSDLIRVTAADHLITNRESRIKLENRLKIATTQYLVLQIRRESVLLDTFNSMWRREQRDLMRPLKIHLGEEMGEEGIDYGGVQQEFFRLAIAEALNPDYGAFTVDHRTKMTWFQPGSLESLWKFELIGMIFSLAIYNGLTLPITFPKALYQKLLRQEVTELHHISDGWPELASGLTTLLEWDESNGLVEDIFVRTYEFSVEQFGQTVSRDMSRSTSWPQFTDSHQRPNPNDAPLVTNENRDRYVSDYILWLTDISVRPQLDAFTKGFFSVIDRRSTTLFDAQTLQSVVEGIQEIDISEMRAHAMYEGWDVSHPSVRDFWSIVKRYDHEQKKKLLEFVTASDRVPVGGMGNLMFKLQRNGEGDDRLPTSATCFGALLMPMYSGREVMREKLELALGNAQGFGNA